MCVFRILVDSPWMSAAKLMAQVRDKTSERSKNQLRLFMCFHSDIFDVCLGSILLALGLLQREVLDIAV